MSASTKQRHIAIAWDEDNKPLEIMEANTPKRLIKAWIKKAHPQARIETFRGTWEQFKKERLS